MHMDSYSDINLLSVVFIPFLLIPSFLFILLTKARDSYDSLGEIQGKEEEGFLCSVPPKDKATSLKHRKKTSECFSWL